MHHQKQQTSRFLGTITMQFFLRLATYIPISLLIACGGGGSGGGGGNQLSNATVGAKTQYATSASATLSNSKSTSLSQILTGITIPSSIPRINETDATTYLTVWTGSDTDRNQLLFLTVAKLRVMNALPSGNSLQVPLGTTVVSYEFYDASGTIIKGTVTL
jgi:hypothetical protein